MTSAFFSSVAAQCYHTNIVIRGHFSISGAALALLLYIHVGNRLESVVALQLTPPETTAPQSQNNNAAREESQRLDKEFQAAVAQYDSGHYAEAAAQLGRLLREVPDSFEAHELLGLTYSAQAQDAKATEHLEKAVCLKPDSAAARTNFATNLARLGKLDSAEAQFKKARELDPRSYDTNHNLGELYVRSGKLAEAVPSLEEAQRISPSSYDNGYDLSLAYVLTGRLADARRLIHQLLLQKNAAELHNLLAEAEEKDGKFIAAVNEYQTAAQMDPSESNLFDWGGELLLHRTLDPAVEVFQKAIERYPNSSRLAVALGIAYYSRGNYDDAVKSLLRAADLSPADPGCYLFLSKAYDSSPTRAEDVIQRFRRFAELQPNNARAQYYLAMSLWKGKRAQDPQLDLTQIESLLKRSVALDPKLAEARLQLGNLYAEQKQFADAIPEYLRALELNADLADAHYRLGQAYVRSGEKDRAQEQFQVYGKIREQHLADLDKQRAEIRQFVYSAKSGSSSDP
jgi:tetratricopeptide (TPR) repeat protein